MNTPRFLLARFGHEDDLLAAIRVVRDAGLSIEDAFTPYAVHGIERALGLRPSRLTWVCFLAGLGGAGLMLLFQAWTSAVDWPLNVGGKPLDSLPAFVPITFEAGVLCAGLGSVLALLVRCRLRPGKKAILPGPGVTDDRFYLVVRLRDASFDATDVERILRPCGLETVEERIGEGAVSGSRARSRDSCCSGSRWRSSPTSRWRRTPNAATSSTPPT